MSIYAVRMTEEDGHPVAWIDMNGAVCIKQPHAPGQLDPWDSAEEAEAWANNHVLELEAYNAAAAAEAAAAVAKAEADAQKLDEIHSMLTELLGR